MEEQRGNAYRYLLYRAMLGIRDIEMFNYPCEPDKLRRVCLAGAIANWLHNLANFASRDFEGFDEAWFWGEYEYYCERYPEMVSYRNTFDGLVEPYLSPNGRHKDQLKSKQRRLRVVKWVLRQSGD